MPDTKDPFEEWDIEEAGREREYRRNLERLQELALSGDATAEAVLRASHAAQRSCSEPRRAAFLEGIVRCLDADRRGSIEPESS